MAAARRTIKGLVKSALGPLVRAGWRRRVDLPPSMWRLRRDPLGFLTLDGTSLHGLLGRWGSPLHVLDLQRLDENCADFLALPPDAEVGCEPCFSYKTNPVPAVLAHLNERGVGAEVISEYELRLALKLGVAPGKIVFNGPGRTPESLALAIGRGVLIHLNNREEIARVARIARELGGKARVGIRVSTQSGWNGQFGESIDSGAALESFREAQRHPELELVAVHCHHGLELATPAALRQFLAPIVELLGRLRAQLHFSPQIIDLGGGLASRTVSQLTSPEVALNRIFGVDLLPRPPHTVLTIRGYTEQIVATFARAYRGANLPLPRLLVEPGRAMTGDTQMLLCRVMNLKAGTEDGPAHAVLDAGVNIAEPVRNRYHQVFPLAPDGGRQRVRYRLVGPICTPMDVLYPNWELPQLERGEPLAIMDSGAYFVPFSTSFSFPQPAIVAVDGAEERLVRRRETFDDMVRRDVSAPAPQELAEPQ